MEPGEHVMDDDEVDRMLKALGVDEGYENPIDYLKDRFIWVYAYKMLPRGGGVDDQDASFIRDLGRMFLKKRALRWKLTQGGGDNASKREKKKHWWQKL